MRNYKVTFFKVERKDDPETGKAERTGKEEYLGYINLDDSKLDNGLTLQAKAFRHCNQVCLTADKVIIQEIKL